MYFSLALSLVSAGFAITTTDRALDTGKSRRIRDPLLFGYVPSIADGAYRQLLAMVVFFASYMASKMFALGVLIVSANRVFVPLWLVAECGTLLGVRMVIGNWRFYLRGADGAAFGLLGHCVQYIGFSPPPSLSSAIPSY